MNKKYKIYTDKSIVVDKHVQLLTPFLGDPDEDLLPNHPQFGRFHRYQNLGLDFLELIEDPSKADIFVYPVKWAKNSPKLLPFIKKAESCDKKVLVFFNDDSDENMNLDFQNVIVFRTSFYKSKQKSNELSYPGWSPDTGVIDWRDKSEMPSVGFCGCFNNNVHRYVSLNSLAKDDRIKTNFRLYDRFWGGWGDGIAPSTDHDYGKKVRKEFTDNINSSDYTLCCRGAGNFSYRIYETLALGRIPIIVNTDIVLPHESFIDWKDISVWIELKDIENIGETIYKFHNSMSPDIFLEKQKKCRLIYKNYIRPTSFFKTWLDTNIRR